MKEYTVNEVHDLMATGAIAVIDIREDEEVVAHSVPGMVNIPMSELQDRLDELPEDTELVLFCRSGRRSAMMADQLNALGDWGDVVNCEGGILAWAAAGLPYEGTPPH